MRNPGPGGTVLGWGDFDVSTSLQWSKRRFRPLELQQIKRIGRRLEKIPELTPDPAHWSALSPARKQAALRQAVDDVMTIFRIPPSRRPRVEFYNGPPGDYGSASWRFDPLAGGRLKPQTRRGVLSININSSVGDAVVTVVHEGRHYYQSWEAYQQSIGRRAHPFATTWRENLPGSGGDYEYSYQTAKTPAGLVYVLDSFGHKIPNPKYFTQPIERDAESFGRRVADRLPLRWRT